MPATSHSTPAPRPLIIRLCNMVGDVVLGVPALKLLQDQGYQLHLYGKGWAASLLAGHGWPCTTRARTLKQRIQQLRDLRAQCLSIDPDFDKRPNMLVMPNSFSSAFEGRWAGLRPCGYARDGRSLLLHRAWKPAPPPEHALTGFWGLACQLTGQQALPPASIDLAVSSAAQAKADQLLTQHGVRSGFICIVPFAAGDVDGKDKRWPDFPTFTQLVLHKDRDIVVCPGPGEEATALKDHPGAICLPGLDLGTYCGLLKRAHLVVSNDTGPAHMAAAVGTPVLSVLGPTKPEQWAPWSPQTRIVQGSTDLWPSTEQVFAQLALCLQQDGT
ncbi:glycosyltransferase family 9 protein [Aquabacterium sp.]|uniref:glycosyltransferase family 9 protein n=1 Tax=Aquabacterium sp. TaxID=1872578 RepID=UPI002489E352|nr:glycosyltransferase family 9 protein [Aquabacterium sp.]MDI1259436.1 glycosyltransferase family 9 protein [Aquabacterium sp.]